MSVNRHPTNPKWWQIKYYPEGKKGGLKVISMPGGTYEEALEYERLLRRESRKEIFSLDSFPTIGQAIPHFMAEYGLEHLPSGIKTMHRYMATIDRYMGKFKFPAIGEERIQRFKQERIDAGLKPTTVNKELSGLSMLLKWAERKGYCSASPKVRRFPAKMTKAPLPDVPTREEVLALINCMIWPRCGLFFCLYYAGLRRSEAIYMQAEDVFLDRSVIIVTGKGNKQRVVPIVDELRPVLEKRLEEVEKGYLWTTRQGIPITDLPQIIRFAKARAGITRRIHPHLLRHAFGTHATMAGVGMRQLQNIMGHSSVTTTEIYTTLGSEALIKDLTEKFGKTGE